MPRFQVQTLGIGCDRWHSWRDFPSREEAVESLHIGVVKLWWSDETEPGVYLDIPPGAHFIQPSLRFFVKVEGSNVLIWRGTAWEPASDADITSFFAKTMEGDGYAYWCPSPFGGLIQCDLRCEEFEFWTWSEGSMRVTVPGNPDSFIGKQEEIRDLIARASLIIWPLDDSSEYVLVSVDSTHTEDAKIVELP